jgi:alginate O-acetyltransferase complex protein AlgI
MLFNDLAFLFLFMPLTLLVVMALCPRQWRPIALILGSLLFYGLSGRLHAAVLLGCVVWVFLIVDKLFTINKNQPVLWLAIFGPLGALVYFKYTNFLISDVLLLGVGTGYTFDLFQNIILPAGISFFTFQLIAYAIDRYRGEIAEPAGFTTLLLFISFFPQLVAGPIVRFHQVAKSLATLSEFRLTIPIACEALIFIVLGLAFKVLVADSINHFVSPLVAEPSKLGLAGLLGVVYSYTFQIYFDFYGYSLCAIGLGRLFGFRLPDNFLRPYSTLNPQEFWRCWHVSLSNFIRDYMYIPLGGNKKYIRNIFFVFVICGLWHGAGYSFIVWGAFHFVLVGGYKLFEPQWDAMPKTVQWFFNFSLVSFGWLFFVYPITDFLTAMGSLAGTDVSALPSLDLILMTIFAALICFFVRAERLVDALPHLNGLISSIAGISIAFLAIVILLFIDRSATFIYFRF